MLGRQNGKECSIHRGYRTMLECVRCGELDCSRCMVQTPKGSRCRYCARRLKPLAFEANIKQYLAAYAATMGLGGVLGAVFVVTLYRFAWIPFLVVILAAGIGYLVGNAVSLATNGKRGRGLSLVATSGVVMAYTAATAVALFRPGAVRYNFIDAGLALLFLTLSLYIAVSRFK